MADDEMLLSLCATKVDVQKRKTEKFEVEIALKNKTSFGTFNVHLTIVALLVELLEKVDVLIYRNFLRMDFTSFKELP